MICKKRNKKLRGVILIVKNGEFYTEINSIMHWIKIEGAENKTRPLVILHGGPGGNHYTFERTTGPYLSKARTVISVSYTHLTLPTKSLV